jgi:hypothetical protein
VHYAVKLTRRKPAPPDPWGFARGRNHNVRDSITFTAPPGENPAENLEKQARRAERRDPVHAAHLRAMAEQARVVESAALAARKAELEAIVGSESS